MTTMTMKSTWLMPLRLLSERSDYYIAWIGVYQERENPSYTHREDKSFERTKHSIAYHSITPSQETIRFYVHTAKFLSTSEKKGMILGISSRTFFNSM